MCRSRRRNPWFAAIVAALAIGATSGCAAARPPAATPVSSSPTTAVADASVPLILVSFDGFRWDYQDRYPTPTLDRLAARGVRSDGLVPVFPTKTFPNHYSLVTGLHPGHHGIVANNIYDAERDASFSLSNRQAVGDGRWWGGEPIWVALERAGRRTATLFWPGSEAEILGIRPTHWLLYDGSIPNEERGDRLLRLLDLPAAERPHFMTLYMSDVDDAGHGYGPDSPEVAAAVERVDAALGHFVAGLEARGLLDLVNLVIVSDHGMAATPRDRAIYLDDYLDLDTVTVVDWTPTLSIRSRTGRHEEVYAALAGKHPHLAVYRDTEIPARFHLPPGPRVTPVFGVVDEGWTITTRARANDPSRRWPGGNHGFDNALESMRGLFIAHGPAFAQGTRVGVLDAINVYALMADVLNVPPAPHDGSLEAMASVRRRQP